MLKYKKYSYILNNCKAILHFCINYKYAIELDKVKHSLVLDEYGA